MSGTLTGGAKAAKTNKQRHGADFYINIGRKGGVKSRGGGFASNIIGADGLTGRQRAVIAGSIGGKQRHIDTELKNNFINEGE